MIRYLIDGHNAIHQIKRYLDLLDRDYVLCQKTFYKDLVIYADTRNVKIVLIFDGNQPWNPPNGNNKVMVKFSGSDRDADSLIKNLAGKWTGRQTVVVTADRSIIREVIAMGCQSLSPKKFDGLIKRKKPWVSRNKQTDDEKPGFLTESEVQWWKKEMKQALSRKKEKD